MIEKEEVLHIANLSRLKFSDERIEEMREHLENALDCFATLNRVVIPLDGFERCPTNALRPDEVGKPLEREKLLQNAPQSDGEAFVIPKILE